ncbi:hypothetical protein Tco_0718916 [Tanacetum coccineum]
MRKIMANDQAYYYSGITSIMVNGKNAYDLKGKFLSDLHKNALSGTNGEDAKLGSDEIEPTNDEASDLEETDHDDEQEIGEIFRIETNMYTKNHGLTLEYGLKPLQLCIVVSHLIIKVGIRSGLPVAREKMDIALKDSELKEEALRNKAIMEGLINEDDESCNNSWRRWDSYEIADHDQEEREYEIGKCLHLPKTTKETRSNTPYPEEGNTPYSSYMEIKYSGRYQTWSLLQETPDMSYPRHWIRRINNIPDPINRKLKNKF